jgi:hypothetical protein
MGGKGRVFFSEEKKQKTFVSLPLQAWRPWPETAAVAEIKPWMAMS